MCNDDLEDDIKIECFNDRVVVFITRSTSSINFFWLAFGVILLMRVVHPPAIADLLLDFESDLSLLLLAIQAVVAGKQGAAIKEILKEIREGEKEIKQKAEEIEGKLSVSHD